MRRERAGTQAMLLLAAVHLRRERDTGGHIERADALGPQELVRRERQRSMGAEPRSSGTLPALCAASTWKRSRARGTEHRSR
jgi:hypothetical protein